MTEFIKFLTTTKAGGYSDCLDRGKGSTLPNCVGFAWAMFYKEHGQTDMTKRPKGNANTLYEACKKDGSGFWVSKALKENSILCFNIGDCGHVVYCFGKMPDGLWICAESNYSGTVLNGKYLRWLVTKDPTSLYKNYQGCIYDFVEEKKKTTKK